MDATSTTAIVQGAITDIGDVLAGSLPLVFGLMGVLIGLFFLWKFIKRNMGGTKG